MRTKVEAVAHPFAATAGASSMIDWNFVCLIWAVIFPVVYLDPQ